MQNVKEQFRLDKRLLNRRGWISTAELDKELAALPDVADKAEATEVDPPATTEQEG